jgi:glutaryl-CoA dehydrogenase
MSNQHGRASFAWDDPLFFAQQLSPEERQVMDSTRAYCQEKLAPRILEAFRDQHMDTSIYREMGERGLIGATLPEAYGGRGLNYVSYGLINRELERVDSGYRTMLSVQSSLVMTAIYDFGNEAIRQKYLPRLAKGEWIGSFGLTEPDHGSDPGGMETRAVKTKGGYLLSGKKRLRQETLDRQ